MNCIGVLIKEPIPGKVKTRLIGPGITAEKAAQLYAAFLQDTLQLIRSVHADFYAAAYDPPATEKFLRALRAAQFWVTEQKGKNFGERMRYFFEESFARGSRRTVLVGSDSPTLPARYLRMALQALENHEVVLGPATDGGYYLVGLSALAPEIFCDVSWSTPQVFFQTQEILRRHGKLNRTYFLPEWYDIDKVRDLRRLRQDIELQHARKESTVPWRTRDALKSIRECDQEVLKNS